jgi:hypothetical protein
MIDLVHFYDIITAENVGTRIPLINPHTQKFKTVTYSAVAISGHLTLKNHIFIQEYVSENINYLFKGFNNYVIEKNMKLYIFGF